MTIIVKNIRIDPGYAVLICAQYGGDKCTQRRLRSDNDFTAFSLEYTTMGQEVSVRGDLLRQVNGFKLPQ